MALTKLNSQVTSHVLLQPHILTGLLENKNLLSLAERGNKNYFWTWNKKKEKTRKLEEIIDIPKEEKKTYMSVENYGCRKRIPECPKYDFGTDRCFDAMPRKRKWFSFKKPPPPKPKPTDCKIPPPPCRQLTFKEYIFGVERIYPHPETCRRLWKERQELMDNDLRLRDPSYEVTEGDVFIYNEPPKIEHDVCKESKGIPPPLLRLPGPVICKMVSDSVSCLDCYCACVSIPREPCETNLCPVHTKPFKLPYDEMKPRNRRLQYLTHKRIWCWDPCQEDPCLDPSTRDGCACASYPESKTPAQNFMCTRQDCTLSEIVQKLKCTKQPHCQKPCSIVEVSKMSRADRLKSLADVDSEVTLPELAPARKNTNLPDPRVGCCIKKL